VVQLLNDSLSDHAVDLFTSRCEAFWSLACDDLDAPWKLATADPSDLEPTVADARLISCLVDRCDRWIVGGRLREVSHVIEHSLKRYSYLGPKDDLSGCHGHEIEELTPRACRYLTLPGGRKASPGAVRFLIEVLLLLPSSADSPIMETE
jgi:hypothetical protein